MTCACRRKQTWSGEWSSAQSASMRFVTSTGGGVTPRWPRCRCCWHVAPQVGRAAMWIYLLIAFVVLPVYLPVAVARTEPPGRRRIAMNLLVVLGVGVSAVLFAAMLRGPVSAELGDFHISYGTGLDAEVAIAAVYIAATCGSLVLSSERSLALLGVVNLVAVVVLARVTLDGFASLWCAWAAVTCGLYALHLRADAPRSAGPGKLSGWADVGGGDSGSRSWPSHRGCSSRGAARSIRARSRSMDQRDSPS
jgi:hypothetical protein